MDGVSGRLETSVSVGNLEPDVLVDSASTICGGSGNRAAEPGSLTEMKQHL